MTTAPITGSVLTSSSTTLSVSKELDSSKSLVKTEEKRPRELWREACLYSTPLPKVLITLVEKYVFSTHDIKNIYEKIIGPFACIPKGIGSILNAEQRNERIREGENEIVSRLIREFDCAQDFQLKQKNYPKFKSLGVAQGFPQATESFVGTDHVGVSFYKGGHRTSMEDFHVFQQLTVTIKEAQHTIPLYGVFDGFSGVKAAEFARDNLGKILTHELMAFNRQGWSLVGIWNALKISCVRLHNAFLKCTHDTDCQGSTIVFAIKCNGQLWIANVGDSRAILNNNGECIALTWDAKPDDPRIQKGVKNRGGHTTMCYGLRITGPQEKHLLLTGRAMGCPGAEGANNARPKITMIPLEHIAPGSELALGCDGIFDVASSLQIQDIIQKNRHLSPGQIARRIVYSVNAQSTDNMTMMIVRFQ